MNDQERLILERRPKTMLAYEGRQLMVVSDYILSKSSEEVKKAICDVYPVVDYLFCKTNDPQVRGFVSEDIEVRGGIGSPIRCIQHNAVTAASERMIYIPNVDACISLREMLQGDKFIDVNHWRFVVEKERSRKMRERQSLCLDVTHTVKGVQYDWRGEVGGGMIGRAANYKEARVGERYKEGNLERIEYHEPMGNGDAHYCDLVFETKVNRVFNLNKIMFVANEEIEPGVDEEDESIYGTGSQNTVGRSVDPIVGECVIDPMINENFQQNSNEGLFNDNLVFDPETGEIKEVKDPNNLAPWTRINLKVLREMLGLEPSEKLPDDLLLKPGVECTSGYIFGAEPEILPEVSTTCYPDDAEDLVELHSENGSQFIASNAMADVLKARLVELKADIGEFISVLNKKY